jgi:hypothetical protein
MERRADVAANALRNVSVPQAMLLDELAHKDRQLAVAKDAARAAAIELQKKASAEPSAHAMPRRALSAHATPRCALCPRHAAAGCAK